MGSKGLVTAMVLIGREQLSAFTHAPWWEEPSMTTHVFRVPRGRAGGTWWKGDCLLHPDRAGHLPIFAQVFVLHKSLDCESWPACKSPL